MDETPMTHTGDDEDLKLPKPVPYPNYAVRLTARSHEGLPRLPGGLGDHLTAVSAATSGIAAIVSSSRFNVDLKDHMTASSALATTLAPPSPLSTLLRQTALAHGIPKGLAGYQKFALGLQNHMTASSALATTLAPPSPLSTLLRQTALAHGIPKGLAGYQKFALGLQSHMTALGLQNHMTAGGALTSRIVAERMSLPRGLTERLTSDLSAGGLGGVSPSRGRGTRIVEHSGRSTGERSSERSRVSRRT
ncbi:hypothetical protein G9U51_02765 [Calidifontibacter sp. DB0510]|uniref:Uncharacterized protein n=1 Tax=Metallococcus carri TaxID=1656884 RepID=A0A967AZN6_9MICO|nr:hypothetical protein [Metallococcus carri]NHN54703.1 hypothetical protein [Metallococcus carri]